VVSRLSVLSSGWPYGSVSWNSLLYSTVRPNVSASYVLLNLVRTDGTSGRIRIFYT